MPTPTSTQSRPAIRGTRAPCAPRWPTPPGRSRTASSGARADVLRASPRPSSGPSSASSGRSRTGSSGRSRKRPALEPRTARGRRSRRRRPGRRRGVAAGIVVSEPSGAADRRQHPRRAGRRRPRRRRPRHRQGGRHAPTGPVLHGAAPTFAPESGGGVPKSTPAAEALRSAPSGAAGGAVDRRQRHRGDAARKGRRRPAPRPRSAAGPAAIKVAREFAGAFVLYETGRDSPEVESDLRRDRDARADQGAAASGRRACPPNVKVPKAKVLNIVPGPTHGGTYTLSVSLLRVGVTSELRLDMQRAQGAERWRVTDVLGLMGRLRKIFVAGPSPRCCWRPALAAALRRRRRPPPPAASRADRRRRRRRGDPAGRHARRPPTPRRSPSRRAAAAPPAEARRSGARSTEDGRTEAEAGTEARRPRKRRCRPPAEPSKSPRPELELRRRRRAAGPDPDLPAGRRRLRPRPAGPGGARRRSTRSRPPSAPTSTSPRPARSAGCSSCPSTWDDLRRRRQRRRRQATPTTPKTRSSPPPATCSAAGMPADTYGAIFAYNHADWYVAEVLANAACYAPNRRPGFAAAALADPADPGAQLRAGAGLAATRSRPTTWTPSRPPPPATNSASAASGRWPPSPGSSPTSAAG